MKIINQTENELLVKDGNWSSVIFGIIFILIGAGLIYSSYVSGSVSIWIGIIFLAVGLLVAFLTSTIIINFNKTNGQFYYQKKNLVGGKSVTYNIADILRIETRKEWRTENTSSSKGISMPRSVLMSQSVILLKSGEELPIDHQKKSSQTIFSSVLMGGQGNGVAIANQIATFLNVPFQEINPPTSGMGINLGPIGEIRL